MSELINNTEGSFSRKNSLCCTCLKQNCISGLIQHFACFIKINPSTSSQPVTCSLAKPVWPVCHINVSHLCAMSVCHLCHVCVSPVSCLGVTSLSCLCCSSGRWTSLWTQPPCPTYRMVPCTSPAPQPPATSRQPVSLLARQHNMQGASLPTLAPVLSLLLPAHLLYF